jgi:hypothetical protein
MLTFPPVLYSLKKSSSKVHGSDIGTQNLYPWDLALIKLHSNASYSCVAQRLSLENKCEVMTSIVLIFIISMRASRHAHLFLRDLTP